MKIEWRKQYKNLYLPKTKPEIIETDEMAYIVIEGEGSPDSLQFSQAVEALYALSYSLKMAPKKGYNIDGYQAYTVFPLEGVWCLNKEGIKMNAKGISANDLRDYYMFKMMIRQPEFTTKSLFEDIKKNAYKKKKNESILKAEYKRIKEPMSCQMMHIGPYKTEPKTFKIMEDFVIKEGYSRKEKYHKEIYISDPRKVAPDKMKTVLRFELKKEVL